MQYAPVLTAEFISRLNRFIALVFLEGRKETVHVKNTGRCRELLLSGAKVILTPGTSEKRKTKYDLIAVYKEGLGWVNIDSQATNAAVKEWLAASPEPFKDVTLVKPEYTYGSSRFDFYLERKNGTKVLMEVKGCTLEREGTGYFPDAPTERGVKHLSELSEAVSHGYECFLAFVIAMPVVTEVLPNIATHPAFGEALQQAEEKGVRVLYLPCDVTPDTLAVTRAIEKATRQYR